MTRKRKLKLKKDNDIRQRLIDIEIDEISLVDKPAIEDEFIITKRVNGKGKKGGITVAKKKKKSKKSNTVQPVKTVKTAKEIQKGVFWKRSFKKDAEEHDHGDHCGFCGITKADEVEKIGMGLRSGVCFKCAVQHMEKDVVDDCIDGTFSFDKFKEKYPDVKLFSKDDDPPSEDDDDEETETEAEKTTRLAAEAKAKAKKDDDSEDDDDEDSDDDDEDEDGDEESEDDDSEDDEESEDDDSKKAKAKAAKEKADKAKAKKLADMKKKSPKARLSKVEKQLEDVVEMLAGSMEFHEQAVAMLSAQAELMMGALEMILMGAQGGGEQAQATVQAAEQLDSALKSFRVTVQKAGAKISASRLATLVDIAEKLTTLIQSVASEEKQQGGKKGGKKNRKSQTSPELETMKKTIASLEKSNSEKNEQLEKMANRLDDIEAFSEGSAGSDDDDFEDDEDSESSSESVFKDFGPLKSTVDRMEKRTRPRIGGSNKT